MSEQAPGNAQTPVDGAPAGETAPEPDVGDVVAPGASYYRNARYILAAALVCYGIWSIHDGFFSWPDQDVKAIQWDLDHGRDPKPPHSDMDILFNKVLGCALPPLGMLLMAWALYNSRGQVRLDGKVLSVPGHPPIPLDRIEAVDKQKWDRKGIALVTYRLDTGRFGKFKLDDFVYDRNGIDRIFKRIEKALLEPHAPKIAPVAAVPKPVTPPRPMRLPPRPQR